MQPLLLLSLATILIFYNPRGVHAVAEDCAHLTREARCSSIFEDLNNCYNSTYHVMLTDCLVTCNACDSYTCSNPQPESVLNCTALASQCESSRFADFMKEKCPATCGACNRKNANLCRDHSDSQICTTMASFCNTVDFYDLLTTECASTCNRCPLNGTTHGPDGSLECADVAADCSRNLERCSNAEYGPLMHRLCAKSCNACQTCEDANKMCSQWIRLGFCTNYNPSVVKKSCAKSCGLCT